MPAPRKYDTETRARAVRMYRDRLTDYRESMIEARRQVGALLDINPPTLRSWIECDDIDDGNRNGVTTAEAAENRALRSRDSGAAISGAAIVGVPRHVTRGTPELRGRTGHWAAPALDGESVGFVNTTVRWRQPLSRHRTVHPSLESAAISKALRGRSVPYADAAEKAGSTPTCRGSSEVIAEGLNPFHMT